MSPELVPLDVLKAHYHDIFSCRLRVQRALNQCQADGVPSSVRRLAQVLRSANALLAQVEADTAATADAGRQKESPCGADVSANSAETLFFDQGLRAAHKELVQLAEHGADVLRQCVRGGGGRGGPIPLTSVGHAAALVGDGSGLVILTFDEGRTGRPESVRFNEVQGEQHRVSRETVSTASPPPSTTPNMSAGESAEETVLREIKSAITHMKEGALHVSELMAKERKQIEENERLLSEGIQQSRDNNRELGKVDLVRSARRPWWVVYVPGGAMAWDHFLAPLWVMLKQVLLMLSVIGVSLCVLIFMSLFSKPRKYIARG